MKKDNQRLSEHITASNYSIIIEPSKDMQTYAGKVTIKAEITKPTKEIQLHSKNSEIKTSSICIGTQCLLPKVSENKETETITLEIQKEIKGDIEIHIEFNGKITEDLAGIYRSKYEHNNKTHYLITTQCEAPYARRIFPCFDEPNKKATFDLTVIIEKHLEAVSNMQIKSQFTKNNNKTIQFKTTPKMSSYLFYLGIGDFEFTEDMYKNINLRIVTAKGKSKNTKFALEHTKKYLEYFENYSEIPYPLEKLDLLAIPDFGAGAMENWGAITFREILLLVDIKTTSVNVQKRSAEVIAHELWHQWSGNLVTMDWWNDLWLNESFANYMAYKAVDHYNPEWKIWTDYLATELSTGLFKDSLKTTHPIEVEVNSPEEIEEIFDEISYQKGGSVLRMLESHIGEESFRIGVSNYLKEYSYSNAAASDLWDSLNNIDKNKKVKELMKYWISQPGHPLVSIEKTPSGLKISQERCNKKTDQVWPIPLSICTENICHNKLLEKKEETYNIKENYIKANHEQLGFYRTKYSKELLKNLAIMVKEKKLNEQDRWGVNSDLWALCSINEEEVKNYLSFVENYLSEDSYNILADISSSIRKLDRLFYYESWWPKTKEKITNKLLQTFKSQLKNLGWNKIEEESTEDTLMRSLCINFCGFANDKETITEAKSRYATNNLTLDTAASIYSIVAQNGDEKTFKDMLNKYENSKELEYKIKLLSSLYQFRETKILDEALNIALTEKVRAQDLRYVFTNTLSNPTTQKVIIKWTKNNWDKIKKHQETHYIFQDFLEALIISQTTEQGKKEVQEFIEKNKIGYEMTKANSFEILDQNIKFIERNREFLKNY
ncbi:M1 family metallopeptidase [Candidatus Pacearchaeota archaeon]|nr:M1 family metallopeptidase [Candidatus Pacearchaeota archaeon]